MINKLLTLALKFRLATIIAGIFICACGYYCYTLLKVEAYPDISDTNVVIIAQYPGRAAEEVEQQVTIPIERALNSVANVISRRSRTIFGLSVVQLTFTESTEDFYARQNVIEKLKYAQLPDGVEPELGPLSTPVGEVFRYVVEGDERYSPMEIRIIQDWLVRPQILQVPGVADVTVFGGPIKQFHLLTSPEKLKRYNLTIKEVIDAVEENNLNTGGGIIERGGQGFAIRGIGAVRGKEDIEKIVITAIDGVPVYMKDITEVEIAPPSPTGVLGYNIPDEKLDITGATEGIVLLKRGENPSDILEKLNAKLEEMKQKELPEGISIRIVYARSALVNYTLKTVSHTLLEGILIVIFVLILFLGDIRSALIVAVTIPFSLLFAFIMMKLTGIPANLLSLGAIDFGIIVDGACIMAERIVFHIKNATEEDKKSGIIEFTKTTAQHIGKEIFFTVTIIICAYLPLFTLQRVEGKLFSPMAYTLSYAVIGSLLCALTLIPVLLSFVFKKKFEMPVIPLENRKKKLFDYVSGAYQALLRGIFAKPVLVVSIAGLLVAGGFALATRIGTEFLPELDEGSIFLRCFQPSGISIVESSKAAPVIRKIISHHPQVKSVITQTGRNDDGTDPFGPNRMEIMVDLKPYDEWVNDTSKKELIETIKRELYTALPGAYFSSGQPIIDQVTEMVNGSAADLAINLSGDDLVQLRAKADTIVSVIKQIEGATDPGIEQEGPQAQIAIEINRENAARYGINVSDIQLMVEAAIGGKVIGTVYDKAKRFDIVVRFLAENRNTVDIISSMLVPSVSGQLIPMRELAEVHIIEGQTNITRSDNKRLITVRTNIKGRDQGGFVKEAQQKLAGKIRTTKGSDLTYGGQFENLERAGSRLLMVIPLTMLIIALILYLMYRNVRDTLVTFLCVPFGVVGGVLALLFRGYYFNVSAGVGFVSLFGVSVMAGVLLVSSFNRSKNNGNDLGENLIKASALELRPILMMITVAMFGLIPAAISNGIGSDIQRPLATVIIGGLLSTLLFTPLIIPPVYYLLERRKLKK
ncbi:MAG: efflux RND transporter permease subunit [Opitutaceae bacterium]|nr:efflux RND transporter permease subunit [Cytophagales bacterium]